MKRHVKAQMAAGQSGLEKPQSSHLELHTCCVISSAPTARLAWSGCQEQLYPSHRSPQEVYSSHFQTRRMRRACPQWNCYVLGMKWMLLLHCLARPSPQPQGQGYHPLSHRGCLKCQGQTSGSWAVGQLNSKTRSILQDLFPCSVHALRSRILIHTRLLVQCLAQRAFATSVWNK